MIGLDSNVIIRYLAQDDDVQSPMTDELMDGLSIVEPGFVSVVVLVETYWVLSRLFKMHGEPLLYQLDGIISAEQIRIEKEELVRRAFRLAQEGADFADALIKLAGDDQGCEYTLTFDKGAVKNAGMRLFA